MEAVKHSNKYGQTISVKHYLNKKAKPIIVNAIETYPIYVQIGLKKKNTQIKSLIINYVSQEDFEYFKSEYQTSINKEIDFILKIILEAKPFVNPAFSLNGILKRSLPKNIGELVEDYLHKIFIREVNKIIKKAAFKMRADLRNTEFTRLKPYISPSILSPPFHSHKYRVVQHISFLRILMPELNTLYNSFPVEFWAFSEYCKHIQLTTSTKIIAYEDWPSSDIDNHLDQVWGVGVRENLNIGLSKLINDYNWNPMRKKREQNGLRTVENLLRRVRKIQKKPRFLRHLHNKAD